MPSRMIWDILIPKPLHRFGGKQVALAERMIGAPAEIAIRGRIDKRLECNVRTALVARLQGDNRGKVTPCAVSRDDERHRTAAAKISTMPVSPDQCHIPI